MLMGIPFPAQLLLFDSHKCKWWVLVNAKPRDEIISFPSWISIVFFFFFFKDTNEIRAEAITLIPSHHVFLKKPLFTG